MVHLEYCSYSIIICLKIEIKSVSTNCTVNELPLGTVDLKKYFLHSNLKSISKEPLQNKV